MLCSAERKWIFLHIRWHLFFQAFLTFQLQWACALCTLRFLFLAVRNGAQCGLMLLYPICFKVWCAVCSEMVSVHHGCKEWLFVFLQPYHHLELLLIKVIMSTELLLLTFFFPYWKQASVNTRDCRVWEKSPEIGNFWNIQTSISGTKKHAMVGYWDSDVWHEHYLKFLTCMSLYIVLLPHKWLIR